MHKLPQAAHVAASALPFACVKHHQLVHPCQEKKPAHRKGNKPHLNSQRPKIFLSLDSRKETKS